MIREALLGLLAVQPMHGYDLKVTLDRTLGGVTRFNVGQVYTALNKLDKDGFIAGERVARDEKGETTVFHLTAQGTEALRQWFASPVDKVDLRDELFMKLVLARRSGQAETAAIVRIQRAGMLGAIQELVRLRELSEGQNDTETVLLIEGALLHLEADLRWLELWEQSSHR
jgi:DNA-binding PadR family transcriptional regulator